MTVSNVLRREPVARCGGGSARVTISIGFCRVTKMIVRKFEACLLAGAAASDSSALQATRMPLNIRDFLSLVKRASDDE
jgi:hypothetical protein